jgi:hypothetical protein
MDGVSCKEDVVNLLFQNINFELVKPADVFTYTNLFDDRNNAYRDMINVLVQYNLSQIHQPNPMQ